MFRGKTIGVVIPAYNEEGLIGQTLDGIPSYVDTAIVVNDGSKDRTREILDQYKAKDPSKFDIVHHEKNQGLGQSLIDGYLRAIELELDVVAVMAGDNQMSPADLPNVIGPIADGKTDYVKGNRLLRDDVWGRMPKHRFFGNNALTLLSKFATGYWHIIDPQCGYTAISKEALARIPIQNMTKGYGYNADILNMLNLNNFRVTDTEVEPVYGAEKSKIKLRSYIPKVSRLLTSLFFKRMLRKYLLRDFNPLVFFYVLSFVSLVGLALPMAIRFVYMYVKLGVVPTTTLSLLAFGTLMGLFCLAFGMWLDMEDNRRLRV